MRNRKYITIMGEAIALFCMIGIIGIMVLSPILCRTSSSRRVRPV